MLCLGQNAGIFGKIVQNVLVAYTYTGNFILNVILVMHNYVSFKGYIMLFITAVLSDFVVIKYHVFPF